jgi:hypothetical protein
METIHALKFRYALPDRADAAEIKRMMEDCPFQAARIETNGQSAEVFFDTPLPPDDEYLKRFIKRMNDYNYKLGTEQ